MSVRALAHKAGLHASAPQGRPEPLPAHRPVGGRQRDAHPHLGHGRPGQHPAQGRGDRRRPHRISRTATSSSRRPWLRSRTWSCAATRSTRPTPRSSCCCATRCRARGSAYFDVESWRVITDARGGELAVSEATVKLVASGRRFVATGEGNGPVNALDHALRQTLAEVYPEIERRADRLPGADPRRAARNRRGDPRPHRDVRRRDVVEHARRRGEHRRGVPAGAGRRDHVRSARHEVPVR